MFGRNANPVNAGPTNVGNYGGRYGTQPYYHRHHHHWFYVWIPVFTAFIWFGTLLSLLITWLATGRPFYSSESPGQKIAYISDVAADFLKPLFIVGCCITGVGFTLTLIVERWLRHSGRLMPDFRRREKAMSILAILGAALGGAGLILLSIFDTARHPSAHRAFLLVFMLGVALSAIFTIAEFRWLNKDLYYSVRRLHISYIAKAIIAFILIALAIAFGVLLESDSNQNNDQDKAAILEWTISFGFTLYLLTFAYDLWGSRSYSKGELLAGVGGPQMAQAPPRTGYA